MTLCHSPFSRKLLDWFESYGRHDLPWQQDLSPYRVWLSEVMLQQTQVTTVIPYFHRFIKRFPTIESLANCDLDDVLGLWSGLGYYSRARNLHRCAKIINEQFCGMFPDELEALYQLPGIGKTTAHAIYSIAFNKKAAILDGNVKRVLIRYFALKHHSNDPSVQKILWQRADALMPDLRTRDYTQAIMDLGALICTPSKPDCPNCPMKTDCQAQTLGLANELPLKKARKLKPIKRAFFLLIHTREQILLIKRPQSGIWGGLWSLPEYSKQSEIKTLSKTIQAKPKPLASFKHTFSHYHLILEPIEIELDNADDLSLELEGQLSWHSKKQLTKLGLAKPIQELLKPHHSESALSPA